MRKVDEHGSTSNNSLRLSSTWDQVLCCNTSAKNTVQADSVKNKTLWKHAFIKYYT